MSELAVLASFFLIAITGHKLGAFLEKHNLFGAHAHHLPKYITPVLAVMSSPATRETLKDYVVHFVIYSKDGILVLLGVH